MIILYIYAISFEKHGEEDFSENTLPQLPAAIGEWDCARKVNMATMALPGEWPE